MKKNKILFAEIVIIVVLLLALVLPRVIGSTQIETLDGYISTIDDLNGHVIGVTNKREESEFASEYLADSKQIEFTTIEDGIEALKSLKIDALVCDNKDAIFAMKNNDELTNFIYPFARKNAYDADLEDLYYFVLRKNDCKFRTTSKTLEDVYTTPGIRVACLTGTDEGESLKKINPNCIIEYYDGFIDLFAALSNNKVDYCFGYSTSGKEIMPSFPNIAAVSEPFVAIKECFALSKTEKGDKLTKEFNDFVHEIQDSGRYEEIVNKWNSEKAVELEETHFTGENGIITISGTGTWHPYSFINNNELSGIFIDMCNIFCEAKGYIPEYEITNFVSEMAGLSTGEYDLMADVCEDTPERRQSVNITDPILMSYSMFFTIADDLPVKTVSKASVFFESLKNNFYKNFIEQNRYKMIIDGLLTTVKISIFSVIFGTLLGILICAMRMSSNTTISAFSRIYIKIVQGTPIVVLILILYYVVFSNTGISGFWTSVFAFTIDFSAYVSEIFRSGIEAVPDGQALAAKALGFSKLQAFIKVVLPQALVNIIPVYSGQFISLVKSTSIVGYIAVQDLTKASDLIRASSYEAFFPLISTAIIYFVISTLLIQLLNIIANKVDPLKRDRKVKGVKTDAI